MATTYNNLYLDVRRQLKAAGVEAATLEARELVCYAADKNREQFLRDMPLYVADNVEKRVHALVDRRLAKCCETVLEVSSGMVICHKGVLPL